MAVEARRLDELASRYLAFLKLAFHEDTGRFRNFFGYEREWLEEVGSEDSHGRTLWALGTATMYAAEEGHRPAARGLFEQALPVVEEFWSPRAWAFTLVGIFHYLRVVPDNEAVRHTGRALAERLLKMHKGVASDDWMWFENSLTYANAKLPHALILAGSVFDNDEFTEAGLEALEWLMRVQTAAEGYFEPVGNDGFYERGGEKASFDQQPIEAYTSVAACLDAYRFSGDREWLSGARAAFEWFLGKNSLGTPLYDAGTGGCRDGLHEDRANENEGAESTLVWLISLLLIRFSGTFALATEEKQ